MQGFKAPGSGRTDKTRIFRKPHFPDPGPYPEAPVKHRSHHYALILQEGIVVARFYHYALIPLHRFHHPVKHRSHHYAFIPICQASFHQQQFR